MKKFPWRKRAVYLFCLLAIAVLVGGWLDMRGWAVAIVLLGFYLQHLFNLYRLEQWLTNPDATYPPVSSGQWAIIFDLLYRWNRTKASQKRRIDDMLRRFRDSTKALPDGMILLDRDDRIVWFNQAAQRLFSFKRADMGQYIGNLVRAPDFVQYLVEGNIAETVDVTAANGTSQLTVELIPYASDEKLMIARDMTHVRAMETMRTDFIANASHELRTPLTVIKGYLETMHDAATTACDADQPELLGNYTPAINNMFIQSQRMEETIRDLLTLTQLESATPGVIETVNVNANLELICDDALTLATDDHNIIIDADPGLMVQGNPDELHSLFSNLVYNAVKYSPFGGDILVQWTTDQRGRATFSVSDSGIGIAPEHIPRLTERFYRINDPRAAGKPGTGLGLAIVKHVLERHDSALRVHSEVNRGSTFSCCFPDHRTVIETNAEVA